MKLTVLGSGAGTEPKPGRKHCSFVIEHAGGVYWFDAGEGCSRTAHLAGIDLLTTRAIFISHPHIDHLAGLPMLMWNLRKIRSRQEYDADKIIGRTICVRIPNMAIWEATAQIVTDAGGGLRRDYTVDAASYQDGAIYDADGLKVTAHHNRHLGQPAAGEQWQSFCLRIEAGGRSVVFSGDVADVEDAYPLLDGCDLFLMETGHHEAPEVCRRLKDSGQSFGSLGFIHHGRSILADPAGQLAQCREILADNVFFTDDRMALEL